MMASRLQRVAMGTLIGLCGVACGCTGKPGPQVVTYRRGTTPSELVTAMYTGVYGLYAGESTTPDHTVELRKGNRLGFIRKADHGIQAVARDQEYPLGARLVDTYSWKSQTPPGE